MELTEARHPPVAVRVDHPVAAVAKIMDEHGVGFVAVLDGERLVGVVTDRDLVRRVLGRGLAADSRIDAVMSAPPITVDATEDDHAVLERLAASGVRRLPVLRDGVFTGVVALDDLLLDAAHDLQQLTRPLRREIILPDRDRPAPLLPA